MSKLTRGAICAMSRLLSTAQNGVSLSSVLGSRSHICTSSSFLSFNCWCRNLIFSLFCGATTLCLLSITSLQSSPPTGLPSVMQSWGTVLGVTSAILAAIQYTPQLIHTYRMRLVGALSIPMMCMQSPGAVLMILGIALRWVLWLFTELSPFNSCLPVLVQTGQVGFHFWLRESCRARSSCYAFCGRCGSTDLGLTILGMRLRQRHRAERSYVRKKGWMRGQPFSDHKQVDCRLQLCVKQVLRWLNEFS